MWRCLGTPREEATHTLSWVGHGHCQQGEGEEGEEKRVEEDAGGMYTCTCTCIRTCTCGPPCANVRLLLQNKKWLLGASVSHAHSEALLRMMNAVSIVTIEVALVALMSKLEMKMRATKLPSCVTVKT